MNLKRAFICGLSIVAIFIVFVTSCASSNQICHKEQHKQINRINSNEKQFDKDMQDVFKEF